MNKHAPLFLLFFIFISCNNDEIDNPIPEPENTEFISAVDISGFPEIAHSNPIFYDSKGKQNDFLNILLQNGINTIRLRLWINPDRKHSGFEEVKQFSQILKSKGFKIWLTLHYSNTWADPGHQETPTTWQGISFTALKDSVFNYTKKVVKKYSPNTFKLATKLIPAFFIPMEK